MNERDAATEALIQEVNEDLKRDQAEKLWKAYGKYVIAAAAVLILGTGGAELWKHWTTSRAQADSALFMAASQQAARGKDAASLDALDSLAKDDRTVYGTLAVLKKASVLAARNDTEQAINAYQTVAASKNLDPVYRESAKLHAILMQIDKGDPAMLEAELDQLSGPAQTWRHSAQEMKALLAIRTGKDAKALEIYTRLSDDSTAPQGLRARAAEARQALEAKGRS